MSLSRREIRVGGRNYLVTSWNEGAPHSVPDKVAYFPATDREAAIVLSQSTSGIAFSQQRKRAPSHASFTGASTSRVARERSEVGQFRVWRVEHLESVPATHQQPETEAAPAQELSWIAFQVMDDDDPAQPMAGLRVKVKTPGGREILALTDANGYVRIDDIDPGQCEVSFPDLDDSEDTDAPADSGRLVFRLPIDPADAKSRDDKFTLTALNDSGFKQEKTISDDAKPGDKCVDLIFEDLDPSDFYTLTIDPGEDGEPYVLRHPEGWLLEDVSYNVLSALARGR